MAFHWTKLQGNPARRKSFVLLPGVFVVLGNHGQPLYTKSFRQTFLFHGYPHIILDANKYSPACNILLVHSSILTAILVNARLVTLDSNTNMQQRFCVLSCQCSYHRQVCLEKKKKKKSLCNFFPSQASYSLPISIKFFSNFLDQIIVVCIQP